MYKKFEKWLNQVFSQALPSEIAAVNFNLYEEEKDCWSIEFAGTERFDAEDEDWACDEIFVTRENPFTWEQQASWEEILDETIGVIREYLEKGQYAEQLKTYQGIGVGFVDGDLEILYQK